MKLLDSQIVELGKAFVQSGMLPKEFGQTQQDYCESIASHTMDYMKALRGMSDD
jgi:hypothetical protein